MKKQETTHSRLEAVVANLYDAATMLKMVRMSGDPAVNAETFADIELGIDTLNQLVVKTMALDGIRPKPRRPRWYDGILAVIQS
jgi:hypothetical protein